MQQKAHTLQKHTAALQEFTDTSIKCNYSDMFMSIPIFDGSKRINSFNGLKVLKLYVYKVEMKSMLKILENKEAVFKITY